MAENKKCINAGFIVGIILIAAAIAVVAAGQSSGVAIMLASVGGVQIGASRRGAGKAAALKDNNTNAKPADKSRDDKPAGE